ncbi:MAG TPA: TIGR03936 family radical SAM-associated protein [Feifaniaceae bacterium]|nr:TIGR03936 family radical SAM-associated protein [Feifaniaceae bacterium]
MRIIANFHKGEPVRFISHLDVMRLLQRAMRRAGLPLKFSQGFNPHPVMAFASALALGYTSDAEWLDVQLLSPVAPEAFVLRMNAALPEGLRILRALEIDERLPTLTALLQRADYGVTLFLQTPEDREKLASGVEAFLSGPIVVTKRTKGGMKQVDIRPQLLSLILTGPDTERAECAALSVAGVLNADGGLQMELLLQAFTQACGVQARWRVHREAVYFNQIEV